MLAAAVRAGAQTIVTANLTDFPSDQLASYDVEAQHPDDFVLAQIDLAPGAIVNVVVEQARSLKSPPSTVSEVLDKLRGCGLVQSVAKLRELLGPTSG